MSLQNTDVGTTEQARGGTLRPAFLAALLLVLAPYLASWIGEGSLFGYPSRLFLPAIVCPAVLILLFFAGASAPPDVPDEGAGDSAASARLLGPLP